MAGEEIAGSIVYEVGAEIEPFLQGGRQVNKVLAEIENALDENISQFKKMDTQVSATAQAVNQSVRSFSGFQNALRQGGYQVQDFIVQVQGGQSALVALSQQGSQLLGVFGTGGAVAGALLTLGTVIVGSLIAGMDNATISTKALTEAQKRLSDIFQVSANGVVVLSDKFAKLAETSENAARAQLTMALIDANNIIKSSVQSVNQLGDALGTWKAPLSAAISQMDALKARGMDVNRALKELGGTYEGNIIGLNQLNQAVNNISDSFGISADDAIKLVQALGAVRQNANPETIAALRDVTVDLSQKYGYANKSLSEFTGKIGEYSLKSDQAKESTRLATEMLQGHKVASEADAEAIAQNTQRLQTYIQMIKDEGATIAMTARQKALYRAEQLGASDEDKKAINTSFDKIEAFKSEQALQKESAKEARKTAAAASSQAKKDVSQQESIAQKLESLKQQSELAAESTSELSREQAMLRAEQSLGSAASQAQIKEAREYAARTWDVANALKMRQQAEQASRFINQEVSAAKVQRDPYTGEAQDPNAQVDEEEQRKLEALAKYRELGVINAQQFEDGKTAIARQASNDRISIAQQEAKRQVDVMNMLLGGIGEGFSGLAEIVSKSAGESNAAYKTLFAISKAFAVAQSTLNLQLALSNAMASGPFPWNMAAMAQVAAAGGQVISSIGAMSYGGGREHGGPVSASSMYRVGEGGKPEIFKASNGSQYMIPGDNGRVISNRDIGGGGGEFNYSPTININGNPDDKTIALVEAAVARGGKQVYQQISGDLASGKGNVSKSLQSGWTAKRRIG